MCVLPLFSFPDNNFQHLKKKKIISASLVVRGVVCVELGFYHVAPFCGIRDGGRERAFGPTVSLKLSLFGESRFFSTSAHNVHSSK